MYRDSPYEVEQRHAKLRARLEELRPRIEALRQLEGEAKSIEQLIATEHAALERRLLLPMLDNLQIASPCSQPWEEMTGDERVRFCARCQKSVYNLSSLTREQAEAVVFQHEGALCARFYRRADGTILTSDCPTGRRRRGYLRGTLATLLASLLTILGFRAGRPSAPPPSTSFRASHRAGWVGGMGRMKRGSSRFTGFEILDRPAPEVTQGLFGASSSPVPPK
jgi:hypothetical protein